MNPHYSPPPDAFDLGLRRRIRARMSGVSPREMALICDLALEDHAPMALTVEELRPHVMRVWLRDALRALPWWRRLAFWWRLWRSTR